MIVNIILGDIDLTVSPFDHILIWDDHIVHIYEVKGLV